MYCELKHTTYIHYFCEFTVTEAAAVEDVMMLLPGWHLYCEDREHFNLL